MTKPCRLSFTKNPIGQSLQETGRRILAKMCPTGQYPAGSCPAYVLQDKKLAEQKFCRARNLQEKDLAGPGTCKTRFCRTRNLQDKNPAGQET